jgi:hypothetical protein
MSEHYTTAAQVRAKVARYLTDAAEVGTEYLLGDLSNVLFNTDVRLVEASAMAIVDGGDTFLAELNELVEQHQDRPDLLAFQVAMLLHRSGS